MSIEVSFFTETPTEKGCVIPVTTQDGATYTIHYRHEWRGPKGWFAVLERCEEVMPPRPPQIEGFGEDIRIPMMDAQGFNASLEAEKRREEWKEFRRG